jgi:DNA-binding transcriptional ArsR family regulator
VGSEVTKEESRHVPPPSPPRAPSPPDYEFSHDILEVRDPEQFKAVGDPTRSKIISLLTEKAATTSQLAEALGQPKGSIGHHLKVLEKVGLIRVVRTRQVRAITEKYYGRTARLFDFREIEDVPGVEPFFLMRLAMRERVRDARAGGRLRGHLYARSRPHPSRQGPGVRGQGKGAGRGVQEPRTGAGREGLRLHRWRLPDGPA